MNNQAPTHSVAYWLEKLHSNGHSLSLKELTYYKSKTQLLDLAVQKRLRSPLSGQYLAPHKGRGMEFAEVRHYQQGDDVRSIDWRVTARTGEAHTKLFQEEKERPVLLMVDLSSSMQFGSQFVFKSVQAAHVAALEAWSACKRGDKLGALVFNEQQHHEFRPQSRDKAVLRVLHAMQDMQHADIGEQVHAGNLLSQLQRMNQLAKPGSVVYLLSDFVELNDEYGDAIERQLQHLARHCEVVAGVISDPFERQLPQFNDTINVDTGRGKISLALDDAHFRRRYHRQAQQFDSQRLQRLSRHCHSLVEISAASALEQQFSLRSA